MEKLRIKPIPHDKREHSGCITGLLDKHKTYIITGDLIKYRNHIGPVFWNRFQRTFGIYFGCWYLDKNPTNPDCYGKFIPIPRDNGMRMELEVIKE